MRAAAAGRLRVGWHHNTKTTQQKSALLVAFYDFARVFRVVVAAFESGLVADVSRVLIFNDT